MASRLLAWNRFSRIATEVISLPHGAIVVIAGVGTVVGGLILVPPPAGTRSHLGPGLRRRTLPLTAG